MAHSTSSLVRFVQSRLRAVADPAKARSMQAYMKTDMLFYGVQRPEQLVVFREMVKRFVPATRREYEAAVRVLWRLPHREEKYAAIDYAARHRLFVASASLKLYERLVREGAWWDLVDGMAGTIISPLYLAERTRLRPVIERWVDDPDMWIRRAALLAHLRHKHETDEKQLFAHCLRRAGEKEFFIRKAIGWTLRQYSYHNPRAVRRFLLANRAQLSTLSLREGARQLVRAGLMH
jgi:3-methyladenine DNA glycosylase AlkD